MELVKTKSVSSNIANNQLRKCFTLSKKAQQRFSKNLIF